MIDIEKILKKNLGKIDIKKVSGSFKINHLYVYINTNCNLRCKYCNSHLLNKFLGNQILATSKFESALKKFLSVSKNPEITFYGGEPLLYKKRLIELVNIIKKQKETVRINLFTNATLLDNSIVNLAQKNQINILISIDGNKKTNDINRKFNFSHNSIYDIIIPKLKKANIFNLLTANMVITRNNVGNLSKSIEHLLKIGFVSINWDIDYDDNWEDKYIQILIREIKKVFIHYIKNIKTKKKLYILSNLYKFNKSDKKTKDIPVLLLNDGNFYLNETAAILENMNKKDKNFKNISQLLKTNRKYLFSFYDYFKNNKQKNKHDKYKMFKKLNNYYEKEMSKLWNKLSNIDVFKKIYNY